MNICEEKKKESTYFVKGNLYKGTALGNDIYMYTGKEGGVCLNNGQNGISMISRTLWFDVTDQYCLQKVK